MLTIKDLAVSKSLDSKEMSVIRGGTAASFIDQKNSQGGFSFASPQNNTAIATVVDVNTPTTNVNKTNNLSALGSQVLAGFF